MHMNKILKAFYNDDDDDMADDDDADDGVRGEPHHSVLVADNREFEDHRFRACDVHHAQVSRRRPQGACEPHGSLAFHTSATCMYAQVFFSNLRNRK